MTLDSAYKYLIARDFGFWQDIDDYYGKPPKLLVLPSLSGTETQVYQQFAQLVTLGLASARALNIDLKWAKLIMSVCNLTAGRSLVPPSEGEVGNTSKQGPCRSCKRLSLLHEFAQVRMM